MEVIHDLTLVILTVKPRFFSKRIQSFISHIEWFYRFMRND